jgi:hypothetical protein
LNYQFKEAETYYLKFKEQASTGQLKEYDVNAQLNGCKYGRKLLSDVTDMIVMEKKEIREESFYDLYDLSNIGGTILVTDEFGTKYDSKVGHRSVIHFPSNSPNIFYSSYGDDGSTGLDIYQKKKLPDGKYSLPQKVRGQVNTDLDEDYAYMDPNGKYLYFSSKGHNSMGGYDVFRSEYDPKRDAFGPPENMDFAISSPDDDLLYVVDSLGRVAYFASRRESLEGKIFVYEVRVERIPMQIAAIKGSFVNSIVSSNKEINIVIEDFSSGRQVGTYNSKSSNGDYFITFPKGGKYKYFMTVKGSDVTHYAVVEVPMLKEMRPLKQRISLLRDETGEQVVQIDNLFDEAFDDPVTVMAEIYRELALLQPNSDDFDLDSLDANQKTDQVFVENGMDAFSTQEDVEHIMEEKVEDLEANLKEDEELSNISYNLAEEKSNQANEKMLEVNKLMDEADKTTDPIEKQRLYDEAYALNNEVEILNNDAQNLVKLGQEIDNEILSKEKDLADAKQILSDVKNVPDGDRTELAKTVKDNSEFFVEYVKDREPKPNHVEQIKKDGNDEFKKANAVNSEIVQLSNDKQQLQDEKKLLEKKLAGTKKKKDREEIEMQILEIGSELNIINDQIATKQKVYDEIVDGEQNNLTAVADEVSDDNYKNSTYSNTLSDSEKSSIANNVKTNDLSDNVAEVDKSLKDKGIGSKVDIFASDEKRANYSLDQWTEDIDREIKNLKDDLNTTPVDRQRPILEQIKEYEDLKDKKIKEYDVVEDPNTIKPDVNRGEILNDYASRKNGIDQIIDDEERRNANLKFNQELKDEIADEKNKLNGMLEEYPDNDNIKNRLKNLEELEDEIDNDINKDKQWLADNGTPVRGNDEIVSDLDADYQNKVNNIYEIVDEGDRKNKIRDLNNSVIDQTNEKIQELDAILENDPSNEDANRQKEELVEFKNKLESNIDEPIIDPILVDADNIDTKVSKDQFIKDYSAKEAAILDKDDEHEKRTAEVKLDQDLSKMVRNEIKQLNDIIAEDPGNKDAKKRLDNLKKLDDEVNKKIVENKQWLADNPKEVTNEVFADVSDVNSGYQDRMNEIGEMPNDKN